MTGTVLSQDFVSGPLYSVSADGMRSVRWGTIVSARRPV